MRGTSNVDVLLLPSAWIGSIEVCQIQEPLNMSANLNELQYSLIFIPGLITGRLFDMGYFKVLLAVSTLIVVAATVLIAECKEYWQFLLCQGFAVGVSPLSRSKI